MTETSRNVGRIWIGDAALEAIIFLFGGRTVRLAAQMRGGFYPAHETAIAHAILFLRPPINEPFAILDPCAGQGEAIRQIGQSLGCRSEQIYAIELDDSRAEVVHAALPQSQILAPADFFGCRVTPNSFSLIWLNPPFDHGYGGHRVEDGFLRNATEWLMPGGIMALVCPEDTVDEYSDARRHFVTHYENCSIMPFPDGHRPFGEVIVFGKKRSKPEVVGFSRLGMKSSESFLPADGICYCIPPGNGPRTFQKVEPTEPELQGMLTTSPLRSHLTAPAETTLPCPPLALGIGHVALILASGHLDGVVHADGKAPHVVRGVARKRTFVSDVSEVDNDDGSTTTKTTISERIDLMIRTVDFTGKITTFSDTDVKDE